MTIKDNTLKTDEIEGMDAEIKPVATLLREHGIETFESCSGGFGCRGLTRISISEGVAWIGGRAFEDCTSLHSAIFLGDAPTTSSTFDDNTNPTFSISHLSTSTDLQIWTTNGVTFSDLDPHKNRTSSVPLDAPRRFLRLVVSEAP